MTREYIEARRRYREFVSDWPEAKRFFRDSVHNGYGKKESLRRTRRRFALEYYAWKYKRGYPETKMDQRLLPDIYAEIPLGRPKPGQRAKK